MKTKRRLKKHESSVDIVSSPMIPEKAIIALAKCYKYRGKDFCTAMRVLEANGFQLISW